MKHRPHKGGRPSNHNDHLSTHVTIIDEIADEERAKTQGNESFNTGKKEISRNELRRQNRCFTCRGIREPNHQCTDKKVKKFEEEKLATKEEVEKELHVTEIVPNGSDITKIEDGVSSSNVSISEKRNIDLHDGVEIEQFADLKFIESANEDVNDFHNVFFQRCNTKDVEKKESLDASTSEVCKSLYVGDVEIVFDRPCGKETNTFENNVFDHNVVPSSLFEDCKTPSNEKSDFGDDMVLTCEGKSKILMCGSPSHIDEFDQKPLA